MIPRLYLSNRPCKNQLHPKRFVSLKRCLTLACSNVLSAAILTVHHSGSAECAEPHLKVSRKFLLKPFRRPMRCAGFVPCSRTPTCPASCRSRTQPTRRTTATPTSAGFGRKVCLETKVLPGDERATSQPSSPCWQLAFFF